MAINKIGVLGAGTMGAGIAQVCVEAGYTVVLVDIEQSMVDQGLKGIFKNWDKAVSKGKKTEEDVGKFKGLLTSATDNSNFKDCDIVIEAIIENIDIKKKVMKGLDELCKADTILATNTSALSITEIAASTNRPDKVVGMHFFNPVTAMKLVEVIPGAETSEAVVNTVVELSNNIRKEPVPVQESPGFIVNRVLIPYINEAAILYQEGAASAEEIDKAMKLGANMPMGPLALADLIGIDVCLMIMNYFWNEFGDSKYRPALSLKQKERAGHLGRKTGKGFFDYN
ncbi:3-hydroxybutyryl-CoA dehydrogenase [Candidatus Syntrophocurvum alkaliphilum]|uniref:3-hydroxybutyryl-CoA dehydrogenase n=1 Tax=Candidatus Syntrophocurvum alkaliphilum TaxID=2293317 RepID=A0A6I6DDG8_9FIRM|nr:3-hydroxyacyl-CoA dehydrogenase NAD-binding domain-containing protein [Candidatus Syntrophocurvum alkaliphilum]QGT98658.1 3-hydroxybutyryl-CoA dehydrogenase [Candidatus Syntrophocurvum alkaliphilum]